jgi:hypothetical protein
MISLPGVAFLQTEMGVFGTRSVYSYTDSASKSRRNFDTGRKATTLVMMDSVEEVPRLNLSEEYGFNRNYTAEQIGKQPYSGQKAGLTWVGRRSFKASCP